MTQWTIQTHTITFSGPVLPEAIGQYYGKQSSEPMLGVRRIRGHEAVGELFEYTVEAEVRNPDFLQNPGDAAQIDLERIIGTPATVTIQIPGIGTYNPNAQGNTGGANIGADTRYISGDIVSAKICCTEDRAAVYEFVLRPSVWTATKRKNSYIFKDTTVIAVLNEVLKKHYSPPDWRISGPWNGQNRYPLRDIIRQAWETDWKFASRLMEEWGLFYWSEHRENGFHSIVISDTMGGFHPHGAAYETLRYHTGSRIDEEHISELNIAYTITPGKVTVNEHNYMDSRLAKNTVPNREMAERDAATAWRSIEIYKPAEFAQPDGKNTNDMHEEGLHFANVTLQAETCLGLRATGKGHLRGLQPGRSFTLKGYPQDKANREYIVLGCDLDITEIGTSSGSQRTYSVDTAFELQPASVYYRLPQVTPRPRINGYEYAVIVAPYEREMWIDDKNRVKIQFDWDRQANCDGSTSIWVRVATQWQGGQMGVVAPGRAGQMVLIAHIHGDPDRPVVAAFVVDKTNMPPWALPDNHALSGMRSRSLEHGGQSNHLALDDTSGKMQAQLASDHAQSRLVLGYNTRIEGNQGRQQARGEGFELATDAHGVARAGKGMLITTEPRDGASASAKDMGETLGRLEAARSLHEALARIAQQNEAQDAHGHQSDLVRTIAAQNEQIRGTGGANNAFPELSGPHLVIDGKAGVEITTPATVHVAAQQAAITTEGHIGIASGRSLFMTIRDTIRLFAQTSPIHLVAAAGDIVLNALTKSIVARAQKQILLESEEILLRAKKFRVEVNGSFLNMDSTGIINGTTGKFLAYASSHGLPGPKDQMVDLSPRQVCIECLLKAAKSGTALVPR